MSWLWDTSSNRSTRSTPADRGEINLRFRCLQQNEEEYDLTTETESSSFNPSRTNRQHRTPEKSVTRLSSVIMVDPIFEYQFRVILIGDSTAGKSSLLRHFTDGTFAEVSDPTVGVDFFARLVKVSDGTAIKLQLWDTAGQERFRSITKSYYRNSVGVLLVYDICNRESYMHIPVWMSEAKRYIEPHKAVFVLVGCKYDLATKDTTGRIREVSEEEAKQFAEYHGIRFFETSAKTGYQVEDVFTCLSQTIYNKIIEGDYRIQDGWDGIKKGYFGGNRYQYGGGSSNRAGHPNTQMSSNTNGLLVAEPARDRLLCCYN